MNKKYFLMLIVSAVLMFFTAACGKSGQSASKSKVLKQVKKSKVLRVGADFIGTPFAFYDENNKPIGFEVELMEAVAEKMGVTIEWIKVPFGVENFTKALEENQVDLIINAISLTKERKDMFLFSDSYFTSGQAIVLRKNEEVPDRFSLKLLKNKKVGVEGNTTGAIFARNNTSAEVIDYDTTKNMIDALINGDVYAIISDVLSTQTTNWPLWKDIKVVLKNLTHEEYGLAMKKGEDEFIILLNKLLKEFKSDPIDGVYAKLYRKWFY